MKLLPPWRFGDNLTWALPVLIGLIALVVGLTVVRSRRSPGAASAAETPLVELRICQPRGADEGTDVSTEWLPLGPRALRPSLPPDQVVLRDGREVLVQLRSDDLAIAPEKAVPTVDVYGLPALQFAFAGTQAEALRKWTADHVGRTCAVVIDGQVRAVAPIEEPLHGIIVVPDGAAVRRG